MSIKNNNYVCLIKIISMLRTDIVKSYPHLICHFDKGKKHFPICIFSVAFLDLLCKLEHS